jgi:hypothetical protein
MAPSPSPLVCPLAPSYLPRAQSLRTSRYTVIRCTARLVLLPFLCNSGTRFVAHNWTAGGSAHCIWFSLPCSLAMPHPQDGRAAVDSARTSSTQPSLFGCRHQTLPMFVFRLGLKLEPPGLESATLPFQQITTKIIQIGRPEGLLSTRPTSYSIYQLISTWPAAAVIGSRRQPPSPSSFCLSTLSCG